MLSVDAKAECIGSKAICDKKLSLIYRNSLAL